MNSTFTITEGMNILQRNDRGAGKVASLDECYRLCSEDEECLSFEFNRDHLACRRSSFTKQMVKDAIPEDVVFDVDKIPILVLYEKNCF
jgi:hypothetical protein